MTNEEKRNIADIVEAFGYINQNIKEAYNKLTQYLQNEKGFKKWKKREPGTKKSKKNHYDFDAYLRGDSTWYYLNTYGTYKNKIIIGFTFVISVDYDEKDDKEYQEFIATLDKNLNPKTPMLLIYGLYQPIEKNAEDFYVVNNNDFNIVDSIIRILDDWKNYETVKLKYDECLNVQIDYEEDGKVAEEYEKWYKEATVKIIQIQDISSPRKAEEIIEDLIDMADNYPKCQNRQIQERR